MEDMQVLAPPIAHSESTVSLASSVSSQASFTDHHPVLDCGIKLPPNTQLQLVPVLSLRPTQLAVGMQAVHKKMEKAAKKQNKGPDALDTFLRKNPIPVILGPGGSMYLIDHHHLASALYRRGISDCYVGVAKDLSNLDEEGFWTAMNEQRLLWQHTHQGEQVDLPTMRQLLPKDVSGLQDDPYRSLAALVRKAGGYTKSTTPFSEFMWANYLRGKVPMVLLAVGDVESYVGRALSHATAPEAAAMPGYAPLEGADTERLDLMANQGPPPAGGAG